MSDKPTILPSYESYPDFALGNAIAHLLCDVREGKNAPHAQRMLRSAMDVLTQRVAIVMPPKED